MISIIIIVKNNKGIRNTIKELIKIPKPEKTEILVIDASEGKLDDIKKEFPEVRWSHFDNRNNKMITIPEQRNIGLKNAQGNIITFIDADCIPDNNWLIELVRPINHEGESVVVGSIRTTGEESIWDVEKIRIYSNNYLSEASSANLAFKREIIKKVGFFDEYFNYGSDTDFTWRIIKKAYKIRYNKDAVIYHEWGNLNDGIKRAFRYGEARAQLYKKHPGNWKNLFGYDMNVLIYPLYIIFLPLTFLLIIIPIIKNIKRQPFKVVFINLIFGLGVLKELFFPKRRN